MTDIYYSIDTFPSLAEIESSGRNLTENHGKLKISILRNITVESIGPYINHLSSQVQHHAEIRFGSYDQILQDTADGNVISPDTDVVMVFSFLPTLSPAFDSGFAGLSDLEIESEFQRLGRFFGLAIDGIRQATDAMVLWYGFEPPIYPSIGIADDQRQGQAAAIQSLNTMLKKILGETPSAYFVNSERCLSRVGVTNYFDLRFWHMGKAPYSRIALAEIANESFKFVRANLGMNKKCLVLDCDNTLWGGILGELGESGIQVGPDYPGSAFQDFQKEVLALHHRGILLALCSKNNEDEVLAILDNHPGMLLRKKHFSTWRINWEHKNENIRAIASDLNIGLDSMVFADDSEFEIGLVQEFLPEVSVLAVETRQPSLNRWILAASGLFDSPSLTTEDKARAALYESERNREELKSKAITLDAYYRSLSMVIQIELGTVETIPRVAQLTQKTNQFNLTTFRYTEADIASFLASEDNDVFVLRVQDRFGDMGIVGVCIASYEGTNVELGTFLLSCRALGRGIEQKFLEEVLHFFAERGKDVVFGQFIATQKNALVADFYLQNGFERLGKKFAEGEGFYRQIRDLEPRSTGHFAAVHSPIVTSGTNRLKKPL